MKFDNRYRCDGCGKSWRKVSAAPVLHDHIWLQIADTHEILCVGCMFERAAERKVYLELSSLRPCPFNLFHWPRSYFNLFAEMETPPTRVPPEWRELMNERERGRQLSRLGGDELPCFKCEHPDARKAQREINDMAAAVMNGGPMPPADTVGDPPPSCCQRKPRLAATGSHHE